MFRRRKRSHQDFSAELQSHIALEVDRLRAGGCSEEEASARAQKAFGNVLRSEERFFESGRTLWLDNCKQDVRDALRGWRRHPAFAAVLIATLALGIGACTAVFSMVDRLLFRGLPYPQADQLVSVGINGPIDANEFMIGHTYVDWRHKPTPFQALTSMLPPGQCDFGNQNAVRVHCISVEYNFLRTFGIAPLLGRDFSREDDLPHAPKVGLISYAFWQARFGGNPGALGQTVQLDDQPVRIAGVLPRTFEMPQLGEADILVPEQLDETVLRRVQTGAFLRCFARLQDGMTMERARDAMRPLFNQAIQDAPAEVRSEIHPALRSLRDRQMQSVRVASWMLLGVVLALLLISCGNAANLLLARAITRRRQMAMRAALGAGRFRLVQSSLIESVLFALFGGAVGCLLAFFMLRVLVAVSPDAMLRLNQAAIDSRALTFSLLASLVAALLFGSLPAFESPRAESLLAWHSIGGRGFTVRHILVACQIAMSLVLLTGATLFSRSLSKLESQPLGMEPERVVSATFVLGAHRYREPAAQDAFYRQLESRLQNTPGIRAFALSDSLPPTGGMHSRPFSTLRIAGHPPVSSQGGMVSYRDVSPGYFQALRIHIAAGRAFNETDRTAATAPVILSATLAQKLFHGENPIGRQIAVGGDINGHTPWSPVVGVAADVKNDGLAAAPTPEYYRVRTWSSDQLGRSAVAIFRTSLPRDGISRWIRHEFGALDPALPVKVEFMDERVSGLASQPRFITLLVGMFAAFGLVLAAVGLYGVLSFLVGQQTREIGVRMALGATPGNVAALTVRIAARWTALGALLGLAGSLVMSRLLRGLLFDISPRDPAALSIAVAVLLFTAALAVWLPTARATRVDPAICLRHD
ncbi:MAG TPA: ABC transporter permease [Bryobacteraceae bacterium]|jgi:predicted permease